MLFFCIYWLFAHFPPQEGDLWPKLPQNYRNYVVREALTLKENALEICLPPENIWRA
jgi:hypothetical protein